MITKTKAIKTARERVSELYRLGDNYKYMAYDPGMDAWHESWPRDYWSARASRAEALIQVAMEAMGHDDGDKYIRYDGGSWTDYIGE
jgi:hypothetical protein